MREFDVSEATDRFDELLDLVERGEEIVITRQGNKVARLVPTPAADDCKDHRTAIPDVWECTKERGFGPRESRES
jgi:prevent-host-death family protein